MLYVNTLSYYDEDNNFRLKEILISDGAETRVLSVEDNLAEFLLPVSLESLVDGWAANISYPVLGYNKTRVYEDDDAKAFSRFLVRKFKPLSRTGSFTPREEKVMFDVLAGFGNAAD